MFNANTCKQCGACLTKCPYIEISPKEAQNEISMMIQGQGTKEILRRCIGCGYCDIICPTQSNPSQLRAEIRQSNVYERGVKCLGVYSDDVPTNFMKIGLEFEKEEKLKKLATFSNPISSKEVFYTGCSIPYIYSDLLHTALLYNLPMIGGLEYCCGGFVRSQFGEKEAKIKGRQLLKKLKNIGVERLITFCPECDKMMSDYYPSIIPEFDIKSMNIAKYILEQHTSGQIKFNTPIKKKVTFQDACAWRKLAPEFHENPRKLLELMGVEVVEMANNREKTRCCGTPVEGKNPMLAAEISEKRVLEAKETGAQAIVVGCAGCFVLSGKAKEHGLELYHILELAQMAIGEKPAHRIVEIKSQLTNNIIKTVTENPELLKQRYIIKNGNLKTV